MTAIPMIGIGTYVSHFGLVIRHSGNMRTSPNAVRSEIKEVEDKKLLQRFKEAGFCPDKLDEVADAVHFAQIID
jgi:hypothetical protein